MGIIVRKLLTESEAVTAAVTRVYPVVTDEATLPYVFYRRTGLQHNPVKTGMPGADTVTVEVTCCAKGYEESIQLAEAVRAALDGAQGEADGLLMRSCVLSDCVEDYESDAFVQQMIFTIKI